MTERTAATVERPIIGFDLDEAGDWRALLGCGHRQHVRHKPPFTNRPWVVTEDGRRSKLGSALNCVRCDQLELPDTFVPYQRTPAYTDSAMPPKLRRDHTTKAGVWAKIIVTQGKLQYHVEDLGVHVELSAGRHGVIAPEVPHRVEPAPGAVFHIEFYRAPA